MRIFSINQQMYTNRTNQNASVNSNNVNFGTKLKGFKTLTKLIPTDHPLIARLRELAKDGKDDRVLKFSWGETYRSGRKTTSHDVDSGDFSTLVVTGCIEPSLNLTPSLKGIHAKTKKKYLDILQKWHMGPQISERIENLSHKVTYTLDNPAQGHFKKPRFNYSYDDSDEFGRVSTFECVDRMKQEFAEGVASWLAKLLKSSDKELDAPVLKSLRKASQG